MELCQEPPGARSALTLVSPTPATEVRFYLDGSKSMQGFAATGGLFGRVLEALRPTLLDLGVETSKVWRVGSGLEALPHTGSFERYDERSHYLQAETNLAAVLDAELARPTQTGLALLLTDGVTSLLQDAGEELVDCQRGSDVHCLSLKVAKLVSSGRGFWMLGFRSRFSGLLFSERAKPGGATLGEVDLPDRPFYLWLLSSDVPRARQMIQQLFARLNVDGDGQQAFALELAPGELPLVLPGPENPTSDTSLFPPETSVGAAAGRYTPPAGGQAGVQAVSCGLLSGTVFGVKLGLSASPFGPMPQGIRPVWRHRADYCWRGEEWPKKLPLTSRAQLSPEALRLLVRTSSFENFIGHQLTLVQLLSREDAWSEARPEARLWSTADDRTVALGNRTLHLADLLDALQSRLKPATQYEQALLTLKFQ